MRIYTDFYYFAFENSGDRQKIPSIEQRGDVLWTEMKQMFHGCTNLGYNATDIPNFDIQANLDQAFNGATSFNGDIGNWDVSLINDMSFAFLNADNFNQYLSSWDVSNVINMNSMFRSANNFN